MLEKLLDIEALRWVRILYSYPEEVTEPLMDVMGEERVCSYLDIPFQHSHPSIVKRMKRGLDGKRALKLLERIRKKIPDVALRTSLVVGFPGEGKREFDDLMDFVIQARFDHLGVFTYSPEKGTSCFELGDPVKERVKLRRKDRIMDIQAEISFANNNKYVERIMDVLIEGTMKQDKNLIIGRGQFQAPEVDGIVFIASPGGRPDIFNTIQKVEITGRDVYDLYGNLIR